MSEAKRKPLEFTIKKKIARKLSMASMSSLSSPSVLKGHLKRDVNDTESGDCLYDDATRVRDNVKDKYNLDLGTLTQQIEKELSSSSSLDDASCWTPEAILNLIDGLRVPLELIVHIIQAVKSALK